MQPHSAVVAFMAFHCQLTAHVTLLSLLGIMTSVLKLYTVTSDHSPVIMERRKYTIQYNRHISCVKRSYNGDEEARADSGSSPASWQGSLVSDRDAKSLLAN